ncbi:MAG: FHA domain-containing protein, partial [Bacilli bacterium]|nr:FHA domain-containing protein [Bacilli bacterium]
MKVLLIKNNRLYSYRLPDTIKNNFWITDIDSFDNERNLINILAIDGNWVLKSNYETQVVSGDRIFDEVLLSDYNFYVIKNESEQNYYYLYALPNIDDSYKVYNINSNGSLKIGKTNTCNIFYGHTLIDDEHAELYYQDGLWQIVDNNSKFGVYVNDKRINQTAPLNYGDVIFIAGLKIIVMNGFLLINNINNYIKVMSDILSYKQNVSYNLDNSVLKEEELDRSLYSKEEYYYRSPRFIEDVMKEEVVIEDPPAKQNDDDNSLLMTIGPMFTMSLTSMVTVYSTINNVLSQDNPDWSRATPSLVMGGAMFLSTLVWPLINRAVEKHKRKKREKERIEKYSAYLDDKKIEILSIIQKQSQTLKDKYITVKDCQNIIMRRRTTLWERSIEQRDFLSLRLGIGNLPIYADVKYSPEHFSLEETDEMKAKVISVVEDNKTLINVPIVISLVEKYITSIIGDPNNTSEFFKSLLIQMMAYHSYEFLKIVILTDSENEYRWKYIHNLPYVFDDMKQTRFYATNLDEVREVSLYLEKIFQDRKASGLKDFYLAPPYYLIITDNYHMYRDIEIINDVLEQDVNYGFSLVIMSNKLQNLPSECKNFINVNREISGIFESEISQGHQKEFKAEFPDGVDVNACIKRIANIPIEFNDEEKQLPTSVSFLQMYNVGKVDQLNVLNRWMMNNSQKSLSVPVGLEKSGTLLKLDLHEKYHGPHGLIAGMTGSGKSEFIITYILSMAINFSPLDVNFILIDYKGGGLAGAFENRETGIRLPHLAGTITNLDVAEMNRSLAS